MALLAPFDRPLALRPLDDETRTGKGFPAVPPSDPSIEPSSGIPASRGSCVGVACFLTHALLSDARSVRDSLAELEASVDEEVVVWSPCMSSSSRTDLVAALVDSDDAITDVRVTILGTSTVGSTVYVEWHLEGRFNNAGFINDDVLVEPSGATVEAAGVLVIAFRQTRATHIRCYYDGLSLLEQVVRPGPRQGG
jgi:hypothetical protein